MSDLQKQLHDALAKITGWFGEKINWGVDGNLPSAQTVGNLFDQYPLSSLLPYESYDDENRIFINKKSMGFILEMSPLTGATEETENILASIISDVLPPHADLQFILCASDKIGHILDRFQEARSGKGTMFEILAKKRTDFLRKGTLNSLSTGGSLILRDFKLYQVVSLPKKESHSHIKTLIARLVELRQDIQSSLESIDIASQDISIENFISQMTDWLNPSKDVYPAKAAWHELDALNLQLTDPEYHLSVFPEKLLFDNEKEQWDVRTFTASGFPKGMSQWRMTENIGQLFKSTMQISCPFVISLNIRALNQEQSIAKAQLKYMDKDKTAKSPLAKFKPAINQEYKDWEYVRRRLSEGDKLVKVFYQVITYACPAEANRAERKLKDLYKANGWKLRKEKFTQLPSFLAMFPMMVTEGLYSDFKFFGRFRTLTAFNAATIAPLQGEWKGTKRPSLLLPGRRGQVAFWNPFDNDDGNYNCAIAASSGSGKSVFTQEYINSIVGSGGRVWVIDVGRSYQKTCRVLGGEFIAFTKDNAICINPFTYIKDFDESLELLKPLSAAMARPSGEITDEETAWLEKGLKAAWLKNGNKATYTDVADWLSKESHKTCKNLAHLLYPYTKEGMYARYFEGACSLNLDNPFVVLELEELKSKKDLQKIMLLVLMYQISERMYLGNRLQMKSCIIDEAWDLMDGDNKAAAKFIETGYRRARRYTANFITITQSINDYFKNPTSIAAYENSDSNIILKQKPESLTALKNSDRLAMDDFSLKIYQSLKKTKSYSECVIKGSSGISVHRILLDPYSRILYSSKGQEFEAVKALEAQGHLLSEAIEIVARKFD